MGTRENIYFRAFIFEREDIEEIPPSLFQIFFFEKIRNTLLRKEKSKNHTFMDHSKKIHQTEEKIFGMILHSIFAVICNRILGLQT